VERWTRTGAGEEGSLLHDKLSGQGIYTGRGRGRGRGRGSGNRNLLAWHGMAHPCNIGTRSRKLASLALADLIGDMVAWWGCPSSGPVDPVAPPNVARIHSSRHQTLHGFGFIIHHSSRPHVARSRKHVKLTVSSVGSQYREGERTEYEMVH
jgi:hypothetical protein